METMGIVKKEPITFQKKKEELYAVMNAKLDSDNFDEAQEIFDKLVRLDDRRKRIKLLCASPDEAHQSSVLMADPIYKETVESRNVEVIEAFKARRMTEEQYAALRDRMYERMITTREYKDTEEAKEKTLLVDHILTTINDIYMRFGDQRGDMLAMYVTEFLSSDKSAHEFDIDYLRNIRQRTDRYALLMQKIVDNQESLLCKIEEERRMAIEEKKRVEANEKYESLRKLHMLYSELNALYDQIVEKEKILYKMLEHLCRSTYDPSLRISGPGGMQTYARCKIRGAFRDGLPYSIPQNFVEYMGKYGTPRGLQLMEDAQALIIEINALQKQLSEKHVELIGKPSLDEENNVYYANSSRVFTSSDIPVPINKMAWRGMADIWKGKRKKKIAYMHE